MISNVIPYGGNEFIPSRSLDNAAGYDVRLYVTDERLDDTRKYLRDNYLVTPRAFANKDGSLLSHVYLDGEKVDSIFVAAQLSNYNQRILALPPGERGLFDLGFSINLTPSSPDLVAAMQIVPRSGWALKHGITILNSPGIVDQDYPGKVGAILHNTGSDLHFFSQGSRIAQVLFTEMPRTVEFNVVNRFEQTDRQGGFGHTDVK